MLLDIWPNHLRQPWRSRAAHYAGMLESRLIDQGLTLWQVASARSLYEWDQNTEGRGALSPMFDPTVRPVDTIDRSLIAIAAADAAGRVAGVVSMLTYDITEGLRQAIIDRTWPYGWPEHWAEGESITYPPDAPDVRTICAGWGGGYWVREDFRSKLPDGTPRPGGSIAPVLMELLRIAAIMKHPEMTHQIGMLPRMESITYPGSAPLDSGYGRGIAAIYDGWRWVRPGHPAVHICPLLAITPVAEVWRRALAPSV